MGDPHLHPNAGMPHMGGHVVNGMPGMMSGDVYGAVQPHYVPAPAMVGQPPSIPSMQASMMDPLLPAPPRPKRMRSETKVMYGGAFPECMKMITSLMSNKQAAPFLMPVDPIALGIPDYPTIITRPMDLTTIQTNLQYSVYGNADEFAEDVRLVWANCEKYNGLDHYITNQANSLRKMFEKQFSQLRTKEFEPLPEGYVPPQAKGKPPKKMAPPGSGVPRADMTYDEKRALCTHINALDPKYLGRVVQIINKCIPNILDERSAGQEEVEISVENLTTTALRELEDYVKELKAQQVI